MSGKSPASPAKRRGTAIIVMILLILISIPIGSFRSLHSARDQVTGAFFNQRDGIFKSLENVSASADRLAAYVGSESAAEVKSANDRLKSAMSERNIKEMAAANAELTVAFHKLTSGAGDAATAAYQSEMDSCLNDIAESDYNRLASEFNEALTKFPADFLKYAAFVTPCDLFV